MNDPLLESLLQFVSTERYRLVLERILAFEDKVVAEGGWHEPNTSDGKRMGWGWYEVQVAPPYLTQLTHASSAWPDRSIFRQRHPGFSSRAPSSWPSFLHYPR